MSDDSPSRGVEVSRLMAKGVDIRPLVPSFDKILGLDSLQKQALASFNALSAASAASVVAQVDKRVLGAAALYRSDVDILVKNMAVLSQSQLHGVTQSIARTIPSLTSTDKAIAAIADLQTFVRQGAAQVQYEQAARSALQGVTKDIASYFRSYERWAASLYPSISIFPPARDSSTWTTQEQEGEVYEIERTDSGIFTAKRGRGRPVGSTYVNQEEYVQVIQLFLNRHGRPPSIRQLAAAIEEVLTIPVSMDTVKRYAVTWFGSWLDVKKYCWQLLKGKD